MIIELRLNIDKLSRLLSHRTIRCSTDSRAYTLQLLSRAAMASYSAKGPLIQLIQRSFPSALPSLDGSGEYSASALLKATYPHTAYTESEKTEVEQWLTTSAHIASPSEDAAKTAQRLSSLNTHLTTRTTVLGSKPSVADIALYARLAPVVTGWSVDERTGKQGYHHIVRHIDFVQNSLLFGLKIDDADKVKVDTDDVKVFVEPIDPKTEKERKKKEKEAAAAAAGAGAATKQTEQTLPVRSIDDEAPTARPEKTKKGSGEAIAAAIGAETPGVAQPGAGQRKEKKEKAAKQPKPQPVAKEASLSPAQIDLRVGHILKATNHPNADSLYVSTIACGDAPGTENTSDYEGQVVRTVCSGLNGLIPLEEMQGRKIIAVCNLKPVTMRGIKSAAMVLAASPRVKEGEADDHKGPVELVDPPQDAVAGDRVYFKGWEGEPETVLNPKKKVWDMCQVGFTTTDASEVAFDASAVSQLEGKTGVAKLMTKGGLCSVKTLKGATVR